MFGFSSMLAMEAWQVLVVADECYSGAIKSCDPSELFKGLGSKGW